MNLANVFGVNVERLLLKWFHGEYALSVVARHGVKDVTFVLLGTNAPLTLIDDWETPLLHAVLTAHTDDSGVAEAPDGTQENVGNKLRFFLRTGVRWTDADPPVHLVEEGDFPWEGAGEYRDFIGGLSGLPGGDLDWEDFKLCVDKLIELLTAVLTAAIERANTLRKQEGAPVGTKYLRNIDVSDLFPEEADEPEVEKTSAS